MYQPLVSNLTTEVPLKCIKSIGESFSLRTFFFSHVPQSKEVADDTDDTQSSSSSIPLIKL